MRRSNMTLMSYCEEAGEKHFCDSESIFLEPTMSNKTLPGIRETNLLSVKHLTETIKKEQPKNLLNYKSIAMSYYKERRRMHNEVVYS